MEISKEDSLIVYPCDFPIRVVAVNEPNIVEELVALVKPLDQTLDSQNITTRPSRQANYIGFGMPVYAVSREQLDAIYMALTSHPKVKMVL